MCVFLFSYVFFFYKTSPVVTDNDIEYGRAKGKAKRPLKVQVKIELKVQLKVKLKDN